VKKRSVSMPSDDGEGEHIRLSSDEESGKRVQSKGKGKQPARDSEPLNEDSEPEPEPEQLNTRTKRRLSFTRDYSFLDPPSVSVSSLEQDAYNSDASSSSSLPVVSFPDPAPELLKCIHHFASCHYRERGQLFDSSRNYRGKKKERRKQSQDNIHALAANASRRNNADSDSEDLIDEEEEDTEEAEDEDDDMGVGDSSREGHRTDSCRKDMYKALDGSALMAIGIVLQEQVAHTLSSRPPSSKEHCTAKRRRTESDCNS